MLAARSSMLPLAAQLARPSAAFAPAIAARFIASQQSAAPTPRRAYATTPEAVKELQQKQARLMEKMSRRKQSANLAMVRSSPPDILFRETLTHLLLPMQRFTDFCCSHLRCVQLSQRQTLLELTSLPLTQRTTSLREAGV